MSGQKAEFVALDLAELDAAIIDRPMKSMFVKMTPAGFTGSSQQRYTVGDLHIASVLASAGLQRFIEENFRILAKLLLGMGESESRAFPRTFERWGNPSPGNIDALFLRLGIEGITKSTFGASSVESYRPILNQINRRRNDVVHGSSKTGTYRTELDRHDFGPDQMREKLSHFAAVFLGILQEIMKRRDDVSGV